MFTKVNENIKKREEAEPQGQALAKGTCKGVKRANAKIMLLEKRAAMITARCEYIP